MKVSYNFTDLFNVQKPSVKEPFVDLPDFDDAFDTVSLRKFYQERESTISQTSYTPQKEDSLFDEFDMEKQSFLTTPLNRFLSNSNCDSFTLEPSRKLSFNSGANSEIQVPSKDFPILNEGSFGFDNQAAPQVFKRASEGMQIYMKNGNMIFNKSNSVGEPAPLKQNHNVFNVFRSTSLGHNRQPELLLHQANFMPKKQQQVVVKNMEDDIDSDFNRKLKAKKIFKIQRQPTSDKTLDNLKKKASSPKRNIKAPSKEQSARSQSSNGNSIVFNFNSKSPLTK